MSTYTKKKLPVYAKLVTKDILRTPVKATEVLYQKMVLYNSEAKQCLRFITENMRSQNPNSPALREMYLLMRKADDIVIDCAHKLAPYQTPKLETIEVRNKVEHKFVMRAPTPVKSVEEWAKLTGADKLNVEQAAAAKIKEYAPEAPSLHDFETAEDDEIRTNKLLN